MSYYVFQAHLCNSSRVKSLSRELLPTILQSKKNKERFETQSKFSCKVPGIHMSHICNSSSYNPGKIKDGGFGSQTNW